MALGSAPKTFSHGEIIKINKARYSIFYSHHSVINDLKPTVFDIERAQISIYQSEEVGLVQVHRSSNLQKLASVRWRIVGTIDLPFEQTEGR